MLTKPSSLEAVPTDAEGWGRALRYAFAAAVRRVPDGYAGDIAAIAVAKVYAHRDRVRTSFRTYLAGVVNNEVAQWHRYTQQHPVALYSADDRPRRAPLWAEQAAHDPADIVEAQESGQALVALCKAILSPMTLRVVGALAQGLSHSETAAHLGCTETNVRVHKHRAKRRLEAVGVGV